LFLQLADFQEKGVICMELGVYYTPDGMRLEVSGAVTLTDLSWQLAVISVTTLALLLLSSK
jgi:hypothetical protein